MPKSALRQRPLLPGRIAKAPASRGCAGHPGESGTASCWWPSAAGRTARRSPNRSTGARPALQRRRREHRQRQPPPSMMSDITHHLAHPRHRAEVVVRTHQIPEADLLVRRHDVDGHLGKNAHGVPAPTIASRHSYQDAERKLSIPSNLLSGRNKAQCTIPPCPTDNMMLTPPPPPVTFVRARQFSLRTRVFLHGKLGRPGGGVLQGHSLPGRPGSERKMSSSITAGRDGLTLPRQWGRTCGLPFRVCSCCHLLRPIEREMNP